MLEQFELWLVENERTFIMIAVGIALSALAMISVLNRRQQWKDKYNPENKEDQFT